MNIQSNIPAKMSIDAFFTWSEAQDSKYELVEGVPRMQPWVKRGHSMIVGNFDFALQTRLDRHVFAVHQGDFAIATGERSIRYADLLVELRNASVDERTTRDAVLLVEVLSDSTLHVDFGAKRDEYLRLPGLSTYIVVAQTTRRVWQWSRDEKGEWPAEPLQITEGAVAIKKLALQIPLEETYRGVI